MTNLAKISDANQAIEVSQLLRQYRRLKSNIERGGELVVEAAQYGSSFGHRVTVTPAINEHIMAEIDENIEAGRQLLLELGFDPDEGDSKADELQHDD